MGVVGRVGRHGCVGRRRRLGGAKICPLLIQMSLDHWDRKGGVPADLGGREIRPSSEKTGVDGRAPRRYGRREHGGMVERDSVGHRVLMGGEEHRGWHHRIESACGWCGYDPKA